MLSVVLWCGASDTRFLASLVFLFFALSSCMLFVFVLFVFFVVRSVC